MRGGCGNAFRDAVRRCMGRGDIKMRPTPPRIINAKGNRSFGGSQMWFENKIMLNSGCDSLMNLWYVKPFLRHFYPMEKPFDRL